MTRNTARRHQHGIEADVADAVIAVSREPRLGGGCDAQALAIGDGPCGVVQFFARLDLFEHQLFLAAINYFNFAALSTPIPLHITKSLCVCKLRPPLRVSNP